MSPATSGRGVGRRAGGRRPITSNDDDEEDVPSRAAARGSRRTRGSPSTQDNDVHHESTAEGSTGPSVVRESTNNYGTTTGSSPTRACIEDPDQDTLRIMISTDNHLGYAEDDNVRGNDSFAALEEVLHLAKHYRCDMVLLAGDLFHENRPTRRTLFKTMEIFRRYCMGSEPIQVQILSSTSAAGTNSAGDGTTAVASERTSKGSSPFARGFCNYEDEFYSVDLPVFSIHGNHDDPSRDGGNSELYAALDLLDVANLVNYFGKQDDSKAITVDPILMKKGTTHVALYGLGSMRDERLNRMWRGEHLTFSIPERSVTREEDDGGGEPGCPTFFNIFCLHQNRDYGRGTKNCIKEDMIPEWMDLVVWGHEHECEIEPSESVVGTFRITQPGSSVATSLVVGEAACKKVGILDVRDSNFRLLPIPLTQIRSFVIGTVNLADEPRLDPDDPKVETKVAKLLEDKVRVLILNAKEKREELLVAAKAAGNVLAHHLDGDDHSEFPLKNILNKEDEVLVRLKVDHTGFSSVNNQRFGAKFVGHVANPTDILLFHRKKAESTGGRSQSSSMKAVKPLEPDQIEELNIEDLIEQQLESADNKLQLFDEKKISSALESYVDKQEAQAINETISSLLGKQQKKLIYNRGDQTAAGGAPRELDGDNDEREKENATRRKRRQQQSNDDGVDDEDERHDDDVAMEESPLSRPATKGRVAATKRGASSRSGAAGNRNYDEDEDEDSGEDDMDVSKPVSRSIKSNTTTRGSNRATPQYTEESGEGDDDDVVEVDPTPTQRGRRTSPKRAVKGKRIDYSMDEASDDDDGDNAEDVESDVVDAPPPPKKRGKASAAATSTTSKQVRGRNSAKGPPTNRGLSQSQLSFQPAKRKAAAPAKRATSSRKRNSQDDDSDDDNFASKGRNYADDDDDDDWGTSKSSRKD